MWGAKGKSIASDLPPQVLSLGVKSPIVVFTLNNSFIRRLPVCEIFTKRILFDLIRLAYLEVVNLYRLEGDDRLSRSGREILMGFDSVELKTWILSKALSRSRINMICVLYLLSSISFSSGCSGNLHGFENVDLTGWQDCGGSSWYIDPDNGHESRFSLRSGPIECTGISRICREVQGPAEVTFWWQSAPLRQGTGELSFTVDGTRHVCNSAEWSPISYTVRDNKTHQLTWEYRKTKCYPKNTGTGWIDDICISSREPATPSEIKLETISATSADNASFFTKIISSGYIIELSNLTIITDQINMQPANVTINPMGDLLITPKDINISPNRVTMNASYVDIYSEAISVEAKGYTNLVVNTSLNATTSAFPATRSINVTIDSIASPLKMIPLRTDLPPSVGIIWPNESSKFFVGKPIAFRFKAEDDGRLQKCCLYINNCHEVNCSKILNNSEDEQVLAHSFNESGSYKWYVVCEDESHQSNTSDKWSISIRPDTVYVDMNKTTGLYEEFGRWYYKGIQEAIDDVVEGSTIIVEPGNYKENLIITVPISLIGNATNSSLKPKILGENNGENNIVAVYSSNVSLSGFEINTLSNKYLCGIYVNNKLKGCRNISICNMTIKKFEDYAIYIKNGSNINISDNDLDSIDLIKQEPCGLFLDGGYRGSVTGNSIINVDRGIEVYNYRDLAIRGNYINYIYAGICIKNITNFNNEECIKTNRFSPDSWKNCCDGCCEVPKRDYDIRE